jgi:LemA protein
MKKSYIVIGVLVLLVLIGGCSYNGMNRQSIEVDEAWANVQTQYQRRADLIPNLVATVKGAANFEKETYVEVAEARAGKLKGITEQLKNVKAEDLTPAQMAELQRAGSEAQESARMMINVAVERYPDLKATGNFSELQAEIAGTENRITDSRRRFNEAVKGYNVKVTSFPGNLLAKMFGFKSRPMFEADKAAEKAPKVEF